MELKVLDTLICRTPVFSVEDNLEVKWPELKILISEASPVFFQAIKNLDFNQLETIDKKTRYSIWKYFNRSRFRATPFGRFAAFTTIAVSNENFPGLVVEQSLLTTNLIDWEKKEEYSNNFRRIVKKSLWFQINTSVYRVGNEIRFLRFKNRRFEITAVQAFSELDAVLKLCIDKTIKQDIYTYMTAHHLLSIKDIDLLLEQLLMLQLLLSEQLPNITGEDYFQRLKVKNSSANNFYTIAERKVISGGINVRTLKNVSPLISFLQVHLPDTPNHSLDEFKKAFSKKFDLAVVPLNIAMDPEIGIGYNNLGHPLEDQDLIDVLNNSKQEANPVVQIAYSKFHRFLLNSLVAGKEVKLEDFESTTQRNSLPLSNSLSVILHFYGDRPVIENIGGCTANALIGRFTVASEVLTKFGQQVAAMESTANPDVLFFDIAYQAEGKIDNVNRRKRLYTTELPILTWSCDHSPIQLNDILIGVRNNEIILWSQKFGKRLVPRVPSAYNYSRSDLAVYRFLCDLQHQGLKTDLNFKIQRFFPDLTLYPRIVYKDIILSPAMWLIPENILRLSNNDAPHKAMAALQEWLQSKGIDFYFKAGFSDQKLCFNPKDATDMISFLSYCRQNQRNGIYISEALLADNTAVSDAENKRYQSEYIINYGHDERVYNGNLNLNHAVRSRFLFHNIIPGGEWLYFEIYCHPSRSNSLLQHQIATLISGNCKKIKKWFFIRYEDPKPHIRLRLQLMDTSLNYDITKQLNSLLEQAFLAGLISDIQIKTYFQEVERYGSDRLALIEYFFFKDSCFVLSLLARRHSIVQLYAVTLTFMERLFEMCYSDINEEISFTTAMANNFRDEFSMTPLSFKKINESFKHYKQLVAIGFKTGLKDISGPYRAVFMETMNNCHDIAQRSKILGDLIHMHVNRLYISDQRCHEAIIYHYMLRILNSRRGILAG